MLGSRCGTGQVGEHTAALGDRPVRRRGPARRADAHPPRRPPGRRRCTVPSLSVTRTESFSADRRTGRLRCAGWIAVGADTGVHGDAQFADHPAQQRAAGLVELLGHQPGRHLDDVGRAARSDAARWRPPDPADRHRSPRRQEPGRRRRRSERRRGSRRDRRGCDRRGSTAGRGRAPEERTRTSRWPAPARRSRRGSRRRSAPTSRPGRSRSTRLPSRSSTRSSPR